MAIASRPATSRRKYLSGVYRSGSTKVASRSAAATMAAIQSVRTPGSGVFTASTGRVRVTPPGRGSSWSPSGASMPRKSRARSKASRHPWPSQGSAAQRSPRPKATSSRVVKSRQRVQGGPTIERCGGMTPPLTPRIRILSSRRARSSRTRAGLPGTEDPQLTAGAGVERVVVPVGLEDEAPAAGDPLAEGAARLLAREHAEGRPEGDQLIALGAGAAAERHLAPAEPAQRERAAAAPAPHAAGVAPVDPAAGLDQHGAARVPGERAEERLVLVDQVRIDIGLAHGEDHRARAAQLEIEREILAQAGEDVLPGAGADAELHVEAGCPGVDVGDLPVDPVVVEGALRPGVEVPDVPRAGEHAAGIAAPPVAEALGHVVVVAAGLDPAGARWGQGRGLRRDRWHGHTDREEEDQRRARARVYPPRSSHFAAPSCWGPGASTSGAAKSLPIRNRSATIPTIRSAAWPSPKGFPPLVIARWATGAVRRWLASSTIMSRSVPTSLPKPDSTTSGRSVTPRRMSTGWCIAGASSWMPPESVSTSTERRITSIMSGYSSGSRRVMPLTPLSSGKTISRTKGLRCTGMTISTPGWSSTSRRKAAQTLRRFWPRFSRRWMVARITCFLSQGNAFRVSSSKMPSCRMHRSASTMVFPVT